MVYQDSERKIERIRCECMNMSPCKDCRERVIACHDSCQKYKDWSDEQNKVKSIKRADQNT